MARMQKAGTYSVSTLSALKSALETHVYGIPIWLCVQRCRPSCPLDLKSLAPPRYG